MVGLMTAFGPEEGMLDFSGTPRDPGDDGVEGAPTAAVPTHNRVRLLGNTTDTDGRPTSLLANIGYEWQYVVVFPAPLACPPFCPPPPHPPHTPHTY